MPGQVQMQEEEGERQEKRVKETSDTHRRRSGIVFSLPGHRFSGFLFSKE